MLLNQQPAALVIREAVDAEPVRQSNYWGMSGSLSAVGRGPRHYNCHRCSGSLSICFRLNWPEAGTWTLALSSKAMHVALQSESGGSCFGKAFHQKNKASVSPHQRQVAATTGHSSAHLGLAG